MRALGHADPALRKELRGKFRAQGEKVRTEYRSSTNSAPLSTGELARSARVNVRQKGVTVGSSLIYAPVVEFGWRGRFTPRKFLMGAFDKKRPEIERTIPKDVDEILTRVFAKEAL